MKPEGLLTEINELAGILEMLAGSSRSEDDLDYIAVKARIKRLRDEQTIRVAREHPAHV